MVSQGCEDEGLRIAEQDTKVVNLRSGGCAGIDNISWRNKLGNNLSDDELEETVERLRQHLLRDSDVKKVTNVLLDCGISKNESLIALVKRYNFDSPGITFSRENYDSWVRIANGNTTINDIRYLVHEIAEVEELRSIQQRTGFDFIGANLNTMRRREKQQWYSDFHELYYMEAHRKALVIEYDFLANQVYLNTNKQISISRNVVAAIDPNRDEGRRYMLVEGVPLQDHHNFSAWQQRGQEIADINRNLRLRLGFYIKPTLQELVRAVKQIKVK